MALSKDPEESAIAKGFQTQNKKNDSAERCELSVKMNTAYYVYRNGGTEFHSDEATNSAAEKKWPGVSFIKLCVEFLLKVYVRSKA